MSPSGPQRQPQAPWTRLAGMGFELAASVAVFMLLGWWVDRHWQLEGHKGLVIGTIIGVIGGMYNFMREAIRALRQEPRPGKRPPADGSGSGDEK